MNKAKNASKMKWIEFDLPREGYFLLRWYEADSTRYRQHPLRKDPLVKLERIPLLIRFQKVPKECLGVVD